MSIRRPSAVSTIIVVVCACLPAGGCGRAPLRLVASGPLHGELVAALSTAPGPARADDRASLVVALDRSLEWFDRPSSQDSFPRDDPPISHARAWAGVAALRTLLAEHTSPAALAAAILRNFDLYESVGGDGDGTVLFTGYYAPVYEGSRVPSDRYRYPLYTAPPDPTLPTRRAIKSDNLLAGLELVWLDNALNAYLVHVNGSARLRLEDGSVMDVGHTATNEHAYTSLGGLLIDAGLARPDAMSMQTIRALHERHPATVETLMLRNDRYVFFRDATGDAWPRGSLGVGLTPERSIATDKRVFPPGGVVLVVAEVPDEHGVMHPYTRLLLDQDTGGAITTAGRADIFMGVGDRAGAVAGRLQSEGRLYYLLLKTVH